MQTMLRRNDATCAFHQAFSSFFGGGPCRWLLICELKTSVEIYKCPKPLVERWREGFLGPKIRGVVVCESDMCTQDRADGDCCYKRWLFEYVYQILVSIVRCGRREGVCC